MNTCMEAKKKDCIKGGRPILEELMPKISFSPKALE